MRSTQLMVGLGSVALAVATLCPPPASAAQAASETVSETTSGFHSQFTPCELVEGAGGVVDLLRQVAREVSGSEGRWAAIYRRTRLLVFAVDEHARMRVMAAIADADDLDSAELRVLLAANYGRALDAKFAIGDGVLWSLFNRPLEGLCRQELLDGMDQVVTLRRNYGSSYRSTELTFGAPPGGGAGMP